MELTELQKIILFGCLAQWLERMGIDPDSYLDKIEKEKVRQITEEISTFNQKEVQFHVCDLYAKMVVEVLR